MAAAALACCRSYDPAPTATGDGGYPGATPGGDGGDRGGSSAGARAQAGAGASLGGEGPSGGSSPVSGAGAPSNGGAGGDSGAGGDAGTGGDGGAAPAPSLSVSNGLQLWLRADRGTTFTDGIVRWADQTANHRDAIQAQVTSQPALVAKGIAEKPAFVFDGVDDFLRLPSLNLDYSAGLSIFMVLRHESTKNDCEAFFEASNGSEVQDIQLGWYRNAVLFEVNAQSLNDPLHPLTDAAPHIVDVIQPAVGDVVQQIDLQQVGKGPVALPPNVQRDEVLLGRTLWTGTCGYLHGAIGEVLLYNRAVSQEERDSIDSYLAARWGCCSE